MVDTTRTIEIKGSVLKLLLLLAAGVALTAGSAWLLTVDFGPNPSPRNWLAIIAAYAGVPVFALCSLVAVRRLLAASEPVVTISPHGILDTRIASGVIRWRDIADISLWTHRQQNFIVLSVSPAVERQIGLRWIAKWTRSANAALGADGLCITATGLRTDDLTLHATCLAYAAAARAKSPGV